MSSLADCLIKIYVLESVLAAFAKNRTEKESLLTGLIFNDNLFELERLTREIVVMCSEGDTQRTQMSILRRLLKFSPGNKENLSDKVTALLLGA